MPFWLAHFQANQSKWGNASGINQEAPSCTSSERKNKLQSYTQSTPLSTSLVVERNNNFKYYKQKLVPVIKMKWDSN